MKLPGGRGFESSRAHSLLIRKMDRKTLLRGIIHGIHFPICVFWFALFFIPVSFWPGRIAFQFWYAMGMVGLEFVWGALVFKKAAPICPLTTWMQSIRGYPLKDKRNYLHSYFYEIFHRFKIPMTKGQVEALLKTTFVLIIVQYFVFTAF